MEDLWLTPRASSPPPAQNVRRGTPDLPTARVSALHGRHPGEAIGSWCPPNVLRGRSEDQEAAAPKLLFDELRVRGISASYRPGWVFLLSGTLKCGADALRVFDVDLHLRDQLLDAREPLLAAQAGDEGDAKVGAVEVSVEVD